MVSRKNILTCIIISLPLCACDKPRIGATSIWPDLSRIPSFRDRLATQEDIDAGRAAFLVPGPNGPRGKPLAVEVPQYAYHFDKEHKNKVPGVLIQAVDIDRFKMGAFKPLSDQGYAVATMDEFELLGTKAPG